MAVLAHALGKLCDKRGVRHDLDVTRDPQTRHSLHLRHDVQLAAAFRAQPGHVAIQLERWAQLRFRTPHPFCDRTDLAVRAGQKREDPVGLSVVELAQHDRPVTIGGQSLSPAPTYWRHPLRSRSCTRRSATDYLP